MQGKGFGGLGSLERKNNERRKGKKKKEKQS